MALEKFEEIKKEYLDLERKLTLPEIISDPEKIKEYGKRHGELRPQVEDYDTFLELKDQYRQAESLYENEEGEMKELAETEMESLRQKISALEKRLNSYLVPRDPDAGKNVIVELRAGTGGEEAALFCAELHRMYTRFAETKNWKVDIYSSNRTGLGGLKEIIFSIEGKNAYEALKWESGVHRVQRVPETESGGRIHTSACSVAVLPQADPVEVDVKKDDLRIDTYRASGKGGQHVNVTDSAVRITHMPTGLVAQCQDERSQFQNKLKAMNILMARLKEKFKSEQATAEEEKRRQQIGSGDRSEKIRTYNFPQNRVTDHRGHVTAYNLQEMLEGTIESFITEVRENIINEQVSG